MSISGLRRQIPKIPDEEPTAWNLFLALGFSIICILFAIIVDRR
jgi:hypothetical protein